MGRAAASRFRASLLANTRIAALRASMQRSARVARAVEAQHAIVVAGLTSRVSLLLSRQLATASVQAVVAAVPAPPRGAAAIASTRVSEG